MTERGHAMTDLSHIEIPEEVASLRRQWRLFVIAYVGQAMGNAAEAARIAGYAEGSAKVTASKLMKRQEIVQAVNALANRVEERANQVSAEKKAKKDAMMRSEIASAEEIHEFFSAVMRGEIGEPETNLAGEVVGMVPAKARDRTRAGELLLRARGEFLDRKEITIRNELQGANLIEIRDRLEAKLAEVNALIAEQGLEIEGHVVAELGDGEAA